METEICRTVQTVGRVYDVWMNYQYDTSQVLLKKAEDETSAESGWEVLGDRISDKVEEISSS